MSEQSQKEEEAAKVKEVEETMTPGKLPLSKRAAKRELKRRQWLESKSVHTNQHDRGSFKTCLLVVLLIMSSTPSPPNRPERRSKQKAERKRKREELRAAGVAAAELPGASGVRKRLKEATMEASSCKVRKWGRGAVQAGTFVIETPFFKMSFCQVGVVIDFSFDDYMHQRDLGKCCKQLLHCYR